MRKAIVLILLALSGAAGSDRAAAQQATQVPSMCQDCHGAVATGKSGALTHADSVSCLTCHHIGFTNDPVVAKERRTEACNGCHAQLPGSHVGVDADMPDCTVCHSIHSDPPVVGGEADQGISARCTSCHSMEHPLHAGSGPDGPTCVQCHTSHTGREFSAQDHTILGGCTQCHEAAHPTHSDVEGVLTCTRCHTEAERPDEAAMRLADSEDCLECHTSLRPAHAGHTGNEGKPVACLECHDFGSAPVVASSDEMAAKCSNCHQEAMEGVMAGGHARARSRGREADLPNCLTCHISHVDPSEAAALTRLTATVRCIECHSEGLTQERFGMPGSVAASYTDDFHGTTMQFLLSHQSAGADYPPVMVCSDCHGAHQVGWSDTDVVAEVCKRCHEDSDERFAGAWLGHDPVGPSNQPLVWMVRVFYLFLIPFMLIGLFLNIAFHIVDQRRSGARVMKTEGVQRLLARLKRQPKPEVAKVTRFSVSDRLDHLGSMLTFIGLVVTGLP